MSIVLLTTSPCPLNVLVGENSPSVWPTISSVTKTGTNITLARGAGTATNITGNKVNVTKFYLEKILDTVSNTTIGIRVSVTIVSAGNTSFTRDFVTSYLFTN